MSNMKELYAKKIGMTQIFDDKGKIIPVTIISVEPNVVVSERTEEKNGYSAKILSAFKKKAALLNKPQLGYFSEGIESRSVLFESKGFEDKNIGDEIGVEIFEYVTYVDVSGRAKGRGYQGVMKRHGVHGGPAGHGSKFHRHIGSSGQSADPSRKRKGTKGAGRMGNNTVTLQNMRVISIDKEYNRLLIQGSVPGAVNAPIRIRPSVKKVVHIVENTSVENNKEVE